MKTTNRSLIAVFAAAIFLTGIFALFSETEAQTTRRTIPAQPRTTPTPQPDMPEIISRANDYLNSSQIINPEAEPADGISSESGNETERLRQLIKELTARIQTLEGGKQNEYDQRQKRLLLNMDILSRAEQRAELLRKQLFELIDKENSIQTRLDQLNYDLRPEMLDRSIAFAGTLRPEELRETRKKTIEGEKRNLENLLTQIQASRASLEENLRRADFLVEKVRLKLEKEIDDALAVDEEETDQP